MAACKKVIKVARTLFAMPESDVSAIAHRRLALD